MAKSIAGLAIELNDLYEELGTWSKVGACYNISRTVVWRIARKGYEPTRKSPETRRKLGLPAIELREVHRNNAGRFIKHDEA